MNEPNSPAVRGPLDATVGRQCVHDGGVCGAGGYCSACEARTDVRVIFDAACDRRDALLLYRALYDSVNRMMAPLGYHGEISARDDRVQAVMDALAAIDGGTMLTPNARLSGRQQP